MTDAAADSDATPASTLPSATPVGSSPGVQVATSAGIVRGRSVEGVARFLGVPFAAPPVGPLRFAAPRAAPPWRGVRDATTAGPNAPQPGRTLPGIDLSPIIGCGWRAGEDYLTVDIWTPEPGGSDLPVMVFIHGGSFIAGEPGAPVYDGTALARSGVVLVALTYRLGVEGFLPLEGGATNVGLRDQLAALAWVQDNVAAFGGDPGSVTVFGESAGGMSLGCLLGSPLSKGLFGRAIVQSGGAEMVRSAPLAARFATALAAELGVQRDAAALRELPFATTLRAQEAMSGPGRRGDLREPDGIDPGFGLGGFLPVLGDDVLPQHPLQAIAAGSAADVDLVVGSNSDEMNLYYIPSGVADVVTAEQVRALLAAVHPRPDELLSGRDATPGAALTRVMNDLVFHGPARRLAEAHAGTGSGRTYAYDFAWRSGACGGRLGACHGLELPFVFGTLPMAVGPEGMLGAEAPQALADRMRESWTAFARCGDPGWPAYRADAPEAYRIDL
ncbi:MAG TPA: carboxylesterase family protein [Pseudonocardia sp.]